MQIGKQQKKGGGESAASPEIKDHLEGLSENLDIIGDKLEGIQESLANVGGEGDGGGEGLGKVLEGLEDNAQENAELNEAQTQVITEQVELLHGDLETFQKSINKRFEGLETKIEKYQKGSREGIAKEMKDLRELLNTVRADIELMKTVVSKLGK